MEVLVIPDVHCRRFWRDAVKRWDGYVVFLGDEVDPYNEENLDSPIQTLTDIISFARENRTRVSLLIGNHAEHYIRKGINASRRDDEIWYQLNALYTDNFDLYSIAKQIDNVLFTHAGVTNNWLKHNKLELPEKDADLYLNQVYNNSPELFWQMSFWRGGFNITGSPLWHSIQEFDLEETHYQVFGHTQIRKNVSIDKWACLDCHKAFIVNTENFEIREYLES